MHAYNVSLQVQHFLNRIIESVTSSVYEDGETFITEWGLLNPSSFLVAASGRPRGACEFTQPNLHFIYRLCKPSALAVAAAMTHAASAFGAVS